MFEIDVSKIDYLGTHKNGLKSPFFRSNGILFFVNYLISKMTKGLIFYTTVVLNITKMISDSDFHIRAHTFQKFISNGLCFNFFTNISKSVIDQGSSLIS